MTGDELKAFIDFSTCSGASAEIAALAEIKADFSARCRGTNGASRAHQGAALEVTISGSSTKEAVLRGIGQLVQEIEAKEDALACASSYAEEAIQRGG